MLFNLKKLRKIVVIFLLISIFTGKGFRIEKNNLKLYEDFKPKNEAIYIVEEGDSIESIARKFKPETMRLENYITILQMKNNVKELIYPGQKFIILK